MIHAEVKAVKKKKLKQRTAFLLQTSENILNPPYSYTHFNLLVPKPPFLLLPELPETARPFSTRCSICSMGSAMLILHVRYL